MSNQSWLTDAIATVACHHPVAKRGEGLQGTGEKNDITDELTGNLRIASGEQKLGGKMFLLQVPANCFSCLPANHPQIMAMKSNVSFCINPLTFFCSGVHLQAAEERPSQANLPKPLALQHPHRLLLLAATLPPSGNLSRNGPRKLGTMTPEQRS